MARSRKTRVAHVITKLELGGAQQNTLWTAGHLDRDRFEPGLFTGPGGTLDDEARALAGVRVEFIPALAREVRPGADLRALAQLVRALRAFEPDIVHTHSSKAGILGRWAAHLAGAPVVIHSIHGFGFHAGQKPAVRRAYETVERATARVTTHFVAVSRANLDAGVALGLFPARKVSLIRSGIELGAFRRAAQGRAAHPQNGSALHAEIGAPADAPIVGMIACLKPQKAPEDFVEAAAIVAREHPAARFVLAGDGERRATVEAAVARHGLAGRFHLLGWRRDVPDLIAACEVLALTSRWEGLPRVIPEAMAAGRPVVATRVDGSAEAVIDGVTGILCEPGRPAEIAAGMSRLLADPAAARAMGEAAAPLAGAWDIDEMVRAQESLYGRLLDSTGVRS